MTQNAETAKKTQERKKRKRRRRNGDAAQVRPGRRAT